MILKNKIITMFKNCNTIIVLIAISFTLAACSDKQLFLETTSSDKTKPEIIKEYSVVNFNGGAYIIYKLPASSNILFVQADYIADGKENNLRVKSSYFSDTITVEGFKEAAEYSVQLKTVSRANVESDPISVKVNPLKPVYQLVAETLNMTADFSGVRVQGDNVNNKSVGIVFLDEILGSLSVRQQTFSADKHISFPVRGYDTIPQLFGAYVVDKWGNKSDTVFTTVKPLYEKQLNRSAFTAYALPDNESVILGGYPLTNMFDNDLGSFWHTTQNSGVIMPIWATFSINSVPVKLSRFKYMPRQGFSQYGHGHPKFFSLWGSNVDNPGPFNVPLLADEGTIIGDWENMGNFEYPEPPSGASRSAATATDKAAFDAGMEYELPFAAPKIRYIRFAVSETFGQGTFTQGAQIDFWGDDR